MFSLVPWNNTKKYNNTTSKETERLWCMEVASAAFLLGGRRAQDLRPANSIGGGGGGRQAVICILLVGPRFGHRQGCEAKMGAHHVPLRQSAKEGK